MNRPNRIVVHHSLTMDSGSVSWGAIGHYHRSVRAWSDIGYHAGCENINGRFECLYGRPWHIQGAHTQGQNHNSLGFCFVGNFDDEDPGVDRVIEAVVRVLAPWCLMFHITPEDIHGHNEYSSKTCPGKMFPMDLLREMVRTELKELS